MNYLILLSGLYVGFLTIANIVAVKIINIGGIYAPSAVIIYAFTFLITDTISEVYGKEKVKQVIITGLVMQVLALILIRIIVLWEPAPYFEHQKEFILIMSANMRIVIASITAYVASQYYDVWIFHLLKKKTKNKHLWLRNNISTWSSQLIDTIIFITIAFFNTMPIVSLIISQYLIKIIIAIIDTPLVYLLVNYLKNKGCGLYK